MSRRKRVDHLTRLLFEGAARGEHRFDGWDFWLDPGTDARAARMVGVHEAMHAQLNDSTAYGTLLHAVAWLARNRPDDARLGGLLDGLVERTRCVHEAYATYLGLLVVGVGEPATELLENNPTYRAYLDQAEAITVGISGGYLRYHAVAATLRACMQGSATAMALERGLDRLRTADLPAETWPDTLFEQISTRIAPDQWISTFESARRERPDLPGWDVIAASESDSAAYREAMAEGFDPTSTFLMERFHAAALECVIDRSAMLSFNGHLPLVTPLIEAAERLLPPGPVRAPLRAAAPGETPEQEIVAVFKGERLVLREEPLAAELLPLPDAEDAARLVSGAGPTAHLFVVARDAARLRAQHCWPRGEPVGDDAPITAVRRVVAYPEGTRNVEHYPLDRPEELVAVVGALPEGFPILCCISMAVYGKENWQAAWLPHLVGSTLLSVLVDLDPFEHLRVWSSQEGLSFRHAAVHLPNEHVPNCVVVLQPDGARALFLIPCSALVAQAITHFVRECVPNPEAFREDPSFLEAADRTAMGVLLGHLLGEEAYFDFGAGRLLRKEGS